MIALDGMRTRTTMAALLFAKAKPGLLQKRKTGPWQNVIRGKAIKARQEVLLSDEKQPKRLFLNPGLGRSKRPAPE
jgi:hypothetical protein